ncbi:SRPBCC family protein [Mycobacterium sp. Aquia_213]|nr:SRPBCC family protein [Mycobacterium sp. Aquia_213]
MANVTATIERTVALVAVLYAARQYYRNWGTTKEECLLRLPGDALIGDPVVQTTEAIYIDSPQSTVWALLTQMGQDQEGAERIGRELQHLEPGDVMRLAPSGWPGLKNGLRMCIAEIEPEQYIVLRATRPSLLWDAVLSIHLLPHWEDRVRLLVRVRIGLRRPGEVLAVELARPLVALTTRRSLIELKHRVERLSSTQRRPVLTSVKDVVHQQLSEVEGA